MESPRKDYALSILESVCKDRDITVNVFGKAIIARAICHTLGDMYNSKLFASVFDKLCSQEELSGNRAKFIKLVNGFSNADKDVLMLTVNESLSEDVFAGLLNYPYNEKEILDMFGEIAC